MLLFTISKHLCKLYATSHNYNNIQGMSYKYLKYYLGSTQTYTRCKTMFLIYHNYWCTRSKILYHKSYSIINPYHTFWLYYRSVLNIKQRYHFLTSVSHIHKMWVYLYIVVCTLHIRSTNFLLATTRKKYQMLINWFLHYTSIKWDKIQYHSISNLV